MDVEKSKGERCLDESKLYQKERRQIKRNFALICFGAVLVLCGFSSFFALQTSINVKAGLGALVMTTICVTTVICCVFIAPFFLRVLGVKKTFLSAEFCYILCVCTNIYPTPVLMVIGGILAGYSEAVYWSILYIIMIYFAKVYNKYSRKTLSQNVVEFCSIGYGIIQFNQIVGNALSFFIFHFIKTSISIPDITNHTESPVTQSMLTSTEEAATKSLQYCGVNDCQDPNVTNANIEQYVPQSRIALYTLVGSGVLLMISGTLVHFFLMTEMPLEVLNEKSESNSRDLDDYDEETSLKACEERNDLNKNYLKNPDVIKNKSRSVMQTYLLSLQTMKDVFSLMITKKQLLITPISIGFGLGSGFMYSEMTRAFSSCVLGVSQVGVSIICYSTSFMLVCAIMRNCCSKSSQFYMIGAAYVVQLGTYLGMLFWPPSHETSWVIYFFFALSGVVSCFWSVILSGLYGADEYKNKEVSFCLYNTLISTGFVILYSLSTVVCVRIKIYIVLTVITIGTILLVYRETYFDGKKSKEISKKTKSTDEEI